MYQSLLTHARTHTHARTQESLGHGSLFKTNNRNWSFPVTVAGAQFLDDKRPLLACRSLTPDEEQRVGGGLPNDLSPADEGDL